MLLVGWWEGLPTCKKNLFSNLGPALGTWPNCGSKSGKIGQLVLHTVHKFIMRNTVEQSLNQRLWQSLGGGGWETRELK